MTIVEFFKNALEVPSFDMYEALYMIIRANVIYFLGIIIARSNKKIMDIHTPFNFLLFVMLGSIFAQAILIKEMFLSVLCTIIVLIFVNYSMKKLAFKIPLFERFVKGVPVDLMTDGKIDWNQMDAHGITERELRNELASQAHTYKLDKVVHATLASDGSINFIFKDIKK